MKVRPIVNESTLDCPACGAGPGNGHRERDCFDMIQWAAAVPDAELEELRAENADLRDQVQAMLAGRHVGDEG